MKRTNIYLEEEQLRLLKHIAIEEGQSFTAVVRHALQDFLARYPGRPLPETSPAAWSQPRKQRLDAGFQPTKAGLPAAYEEEVSAPL